MTELRADDTRVAVWSCDLAPDNAELAASDLLVCAVDVCNLLAAVEVGGFGGVDACKFYQSMSKPVFPSLVARTF